jgi:glycosyl transferase family 2
VSVTPPRSLFARAARPLRTSAAGLRRAWRKLSARSPDRLVVSLTSFPPRIGEAHNVVRALLGQSVRARKIVLYLSLDEFPDRRVPRALDELVQDRFEIRYVPGNLGPYKKLLYALDDFPDCFIATCDDDRVCPPDWLERLWFAALDHPRTIVCTRGRRILSDDAGFRPYEEWPKIKSFGPSHFLLPLGSWGTLYPPDAFCPEARDRALIHALAPLQDDLWFKVMSLTRDVPCLAVGGHQYMRKLEFEDATKLWDINQTQNDIVWDRTLRHFDLGLEAMLAKEEQRSATRSRRRPLTPGGSARPPRR